MVYRVYSGRAILPAVQRAPAGGVWLNPPQPASTIPVVIGFGIFEAVLLAAIFPLVGWRSIKVTEKGLQVQDCSILCIGCNLRTIKWSEARLFAIYPTRNRADPPRFYELSGAY